MSEPPWWQKAVIYEIYPRSFQDSDGDGVGDLAGVLRRVDYLSWLGVDAVWICPIYPSPMADFGYDVADYVGIDPLFGTVADFERLAAGLHERGIRLVLDFVPNHSSDQHPWFQEARASRESPRRDWYIWRDPAPDGGAPNNWVSQAGGSAWAFDEATGQYYYHAFLKEQPDLNWRNPAVRQAMYDVLRFWLARGVDGFRVDVLWHMIKDAQFRDDPLNPDYREGQPDFRRVQARYSADQPEVLEVAQEMRRVLAEYPGERLLIGEIYLPVERLVAYYGADLGAVHLPFNFNLMWAPWQPAPIMRLIESYEAVLPPGGWPSWVLGNHDQMRIASRVGPAQARVAMVLLLTLRGTPTLYYGDELGLENVPIPAGRERDPFGIRQPGTGQGRDPVRTPMPWDGTANCGFTEGEPWLPLGEGRSAQSVAAQRRDPGSMLALTRELLALRRREPALSLGDWTPLAAEGDVLAYARTWRDQRFIVALNLTAAPTAVRFGDDLAGRIEISTQPARAGQLVTARIELGANEAVVIAAGGGRSKRAPRNGAARSVEAEPTPAGRDPRPGRR
jgi:alpha-glucosidase